MDRRLVGKGQEVEQEVDRGWTGGGQFYVSGQEARQRWG